MNHLISILEYTYEDILSLLSICYLTACKKLDKEEQKRNHLRIKNVQYIAICDKRRWE